MKVPKSEAHNVTKSSNSSLAATPGGGQMLKDENQPTPGSLGGAPTPGGPNTPGGGGGVMTPGGMKADIKEEKDEMKLGDIKHEQNGLDNSLEDFKPMLDDIKPKIEDCLGTLEDNDGDPKTPGALAGPDLQHQMSGGPGSVPPANKMDPTMPGGGGGAGAGMPGGNPAAHPGLQPQSSMPGTGVDGHFMQQQSQIFVFSTSLANKAAEMVRSGEYNSIRDFHMDQPGTKNFLQSLPLQSKVAFSRANSAPGGGMNPMGAMGVNSNKGSPMMNSDSMSSVEQWVRQQNANLEQGNFSSPPHSQMNPSNPDSFSPSGINFPPGQGPPSMPSQGPWQEGGPPPHDIASPDSAMNNPNFPGGPGGFMGSGPGGMGPGRMGPQGSGANLLHNKVPDENLTPEQLHRREEQLASLRKIQAMLFPERDGGGPNGPGPGGMMGPNGPNGPGNMPPMMTSQPNMMPPQSGMSSPGMMGMPGGPGGGPPIGPPFGPQPPPNFENLTPAQREWFKLQQEFYHDKRRKQEMERIRHFQQMQQMGMPGPGPGDGPYFRGMRPGMPGPMSPTSPTFPGPHGPNDPSGFMMGPRRPGPMGFNGPGGPNFDPLGGPGSGFPFKDDMIRPPHKGGMPMIQRAGNPEQFNPEMLPANPSAPGPTKPPPPYNQAQKRKRSGEDMDELYKKLQPAPSPQQFSYLNQFEGQELTITKQLNMAYQEPKSEPSPAQNNSQPQPSLAPPPQVNTSAPSGGPPASQSTGPPSQAAPKSHHSSQPPTPSSQPQPSPRPPATSSSAAPNASSSAAAPPVSSIASPSVQTATSSRPSSVSGVNTTTAQNNLPVRSPLPPSSKSQPSSQNAPPPSSQVAAATQRLSHFDGSNGPPPTTSKNSTMSNITSASLANLAKGVEHLSNQMQQNMMHGGPFHNIQIQGQMSEMDNGPMAPVAGQAPPPSHGPNTSQSPSCSLPQGHPQAINNTYVNANVSIGQLNIQSGSHPGATNTYNANMQVQQMTNEVQGGPNGPQTMSSMSQQQMSHHMTSQHGGPPQDPMMGPSPGSKMPGGPNLQRPFPGQSPQLPGDSMVNSPGFPRSSANTVGNANVQIQAKAPNTIQYLPANPPSSQPGPGGPGPAMGGPLGGGPPSSIPGGPPGAPMPPASLPGGPPPQRKEMEMMGMPPRFPSPLPGMDGPPRTKYFNPGPPGQGGPMGGPMGPGDMMGPRMPVSAMGPHPGSQGQGPMMQQSMMMSNSMMHQQMGGPMQGCMGSPGTGPMDGPNGPMGPMVPEMMQGQMQMQGMSMHGPGGPVMGGPGMRPEAGMMGGPPGPGGQGYLSSNFLQFQQQLYAQGRPRHMNPAMGGPRMGMPDHMMGGPGMVPGMGLPEMGGMSAGPRGMVPPGMMPGHMGGPGPMGGGPGMMGMPNMP